MPKKSYDQRIKERWDRKEKKDKQSWEGNRLYGGFSNMSSIMGGMALILPLLFSRRKK